LDTTYHTTTHAGDYIHFNFTGAFASALVCSSTDYTPATGTAVTVFGFRDSTSGKFSVQLDNESSIVLNGESSSKEATNLFFRSGLNNSLHTLTITNVEDRLLAIGSINVTAASSHS
jgi:hypothetical protein